MMIEKYSRGALLLALLLPLAGPSLAASGPSSEERKLEELRNTVVNMLQALVDKGILTREQAQAMVKNAQDKAAADVAAQSAAAEAQEESEQNAIRVPYIPDVVKEQIKKEVAQEVTPEVTKQVVAEAKSEQWGVPGALPDWLKRVTLSGDVRLRGEGDVFGRDNIPNIYLNFNAVNAAGGKDKAGLSAFLNTNTNRYYLVGRLRFNLDAELGSGWSAGARLSTGTLTNPDSTNQVLGQYGARYQTNVDLAYIKWMGATASGRQQVSVWGGRFPNPFISTDMVWDTDVTLEGLAFSYRFNIPGAPVGSRGVFATLGAIPVQEIALSQNDKWLYAGQIGVDFKLTDTVRTGLSAAYYYYDHLHGIENPPNSSLFDYTAPPYMQKGNTLFDIRNDQDTTTNLFALASDYHLLDIDGSLGWNVTSRYRMDLTGDFVRNLGYKTDEVSARIGAPVQPRINGYSAELGFGSAVMNHFGAWHGFVSYKYIMRDAVLDAFNDQDFHLGGTDAKGFIAGFDLTVTPRVWTRLRYISTDAIDGPPLSVDVWQLDVNARF
jgi:hypothetical protein